MNPDGLDSDSMGSLDPDPDPRGQNDPKKYKKRRNFIFLSAGFSLLNVLSGGLGISKLQFLSTRKGKKKFPIFGYLNVSGHGSGFT